MCLMLICSLRVDTIRATGQDHTKCSGIIVAGRCNSNFVRTGILCTGIDRECPMWVDLTMIDIRIIAGVGAEVSGEITISIDFPGYVVTKDTANERIRISDL